MSQKEQVLNHIRRYGKISSMESFKRYGITRLSAMVHLLRRDGVVIKTNFVIRGKKHFGEYSF